MNHSASSERLRRGLLQSSGVCDPDTEPRRWIQHGGLAGSQMITPQESFMFGGTLLVGHSLQRKLSVRLMFQSSRSPRSDDVRFTCEKQLQLLQGFDATNIGVCIETKEIGL
jgi:hypothetical protein